MTPIAFFLQKGAPEFFAALRYWIVEPFAILKKWQRRMLEIFGEKIQWLQSLQPFTGVHFSNELLDAKLPGHTPRRARYAATGRGS